MHKTLRCTCGRIAHFPKHARRGDQWECYRCGMIWTIAPASMGGQPLVKRQSRPPDPAPQVIILPVVRELPVPPQANPFLEPGARQLPLPSRRPQPQPTPGCLPALLAMVGIGAGGAWWLVSQLV